LVPEEASLSQYSEDGAFSQQGSALNNPTCSYSFMDVRWLMTNGRFKARQKKWYYKMSDKTINNKQGL
jgi:hypothetical protein